MKTLEETLESAAQLMDILVSSNENSDKQASAFASMLHVIKFSYMVEDRDWLRDRLMTLVKERLAMRGEMIEGKSH